jgi:hypothetical protein
VTVRHTSSAKSATAATNLLVRSDDLKTEIRANTAAGGRPGVGIALAAREFRKGESLLLGAAVRSGHASAIGASGAPLDYRPLMAALITRPRQVQVLTVNDLL